MIVTIIAILIGLAIFCGGVYYLVREKADQESRKIYTVTTIIGAVILVAAVLKIVIWGL